MNCGNTVTKIQQIDDPYPDCCNAVMMKLPTYPVMVKIRGEGGYPSRRKFVKGSAPGTTRQTKPWLSVDPQEKINYGFGKT
jgi:hypothetical protein